MPGLDGQKMSKSYGNTIALREEPESVAKKIRTMPTDPARVKRTDPGNPEKCPVWSLAQGVFGRGDASSGCTKGCTTRGHRLPGVQAAGDRRDQRELAPMRERARRPISTTRRWSKTSSPTAATSAKRLAAETMREVREAMGLSL